MLSDDAPLGSTGRVHHDCAVSIDTAPDRASGPCVGESLGEWLVVRVHPDVGLDSEGGTYPVRWPAHFSRGTRRSDQPSHPAARGRGDRRRHVRTRRVSCSEQDLRPRGRRVSCAASEGAEHDAPLRNVSRPYSLNPVVTQYKFEPHWLGRGSPDRSSSRRSPLSFASSSPPKNVATSPTVKGCGASPSTAGGRT